MKYDALAYLNKLNLYIWQTKSNTTNQLDLIHSYEPDSLFTSIHILHNGRNHYDKLTFTRDTEAQLSKYSEMLQVKTRKRGKKKKAPSSLDIPNKTSNVENNDTESNRQKNA